MLCSSVTLIRMVRYVRIDYHAYQDNQALEIRHASKCSLLLETVSLGAGSSRKQPHRWSTVPIIERNLRLNFFAKRMFRKRLVARGIRYSLPDFDSSRTRRTLRCSDTHHSSHIFNSHPELKYGFTRFGRCLFVTTPMYHFSWVRRYCNCTKPWEVPHWLDETPAMIM